MFLGWGVEPTVLILVGLLFVCVLSDFIVSGLSARLSLATSLWQEKYLLNNKDRGSQFLIFLVLFQIISWDKKSFFRQLPSFAQVFSLNSKQFSSTLVASLLGFSLSFLLLWPLPFFLLFLFTILGLILIFQQEKILQDFGVGSLLFALYSLLNLFLDRGLKEVGLSVIPIEFSEFMAVTLIVLSILLFKTIVPFIVTLASLQLLFGLSYHWWPLFLFSQLFLLTVQGFWKHRKERRSFFRLYFTLLSATLLATLLFAVLLNRSEGLMNQFGSRQSWISALQYTLCLCALYYAGFLVLLLFLFPKRTANDERPPLVPCGHEEGDSFSFILSLVRLRQELSLYQSGLIQALNSLRLDLKKVKQPFQSGPQRALLLKKSDDIKELCFQLGRKPSYPEHVQEVMNTYRLLNHYESLWMDLLLIAQDFMLKEPEKVDASLSEWMNIQLDLFIYFLGSESNLLAYPDEEHLEKSYELIEKLLFVNSEKGGKSPFYRVTDSLARKLSSPRTL